MLRKCTKSKKCWKFSNCYILVLSFLFALGYLGLLQCQIVISYCWYWEMWRLCSLVGRSMFTPCCSAQEKCYSRSASHSLCITAVRGWCGLNRMCPSAWACSLTQHLGFAHCHPSPRFFHKQNMKRCCCSGWCWARQMSLQILVQRVQSPLCIFHLSVHCWGRGGTGKQGPLWWTWQCRR